MHIFIFFANAYVLKNQKDFKDLFSISLVNLHETSLVHLDEPRDLIILSHKLNVIVIPMKVS